ncbi:MAG: nicotinic acid mononucleotide adenylyltransferase [Candidatus Hydromicrobium americanum]|nr:MAG: nicotinic acid mononucleotide adenylyltransferase [Candidatus Hydromicrobium americanum]
MEKSSKFYKKIGIMGGTFNPIHHGHLVTAQEALSQFKLDKVIFIPTGNPPHKIENEVASAEDRYIMTVIATSSNSNFFVSRMEIDRKGKSYTIDTVRQLRKIYGKNSLLYFITGADAILEILTWKNTDEIVSLCKFIAATRPGYNLSRIEDLRKRLFGKAGAADEKIYVMEIPALSISSTDIRNRIKHNRPIDYLLPERVSNYILKHELYK